MNAKRITDQKWGINMQDVITNFLVAKCNAYKSRKYAHCQMLLSSLWLGKRSRKWLQWLFCGVHLNWEGERKRNLIFLSFFFSFSPSFFLSPSFPPSFQARTMWHIAKIYWYAISLYFQASKRLVVFPSVKTWSHELLRAMTRIYVW